MTDETAEETQQEQTQEASIENLMDDIFNDSEETKEESAKTEESDSSEEEKGEESSESEEEPETPSGEESSVPREALLAERRKRQEAEKQLKSLQEEKQSVPDPVDDPEGYAKHMESRQNQALVQERIRLSRDLMMDSKEDYSDKEKVFMELIGEADDDGNFSITDQTLYDKFLAAPNPARFAYNHAAEHLEVQELKSPEYKERLREQIRKEEREKLEKEKRTAGVPDLTTATAEGSNSPNPVKDSGTLDEVFDD